MFKEEGDKLENELFKIIVSQGSWAVLFVWLLIDTRKESKIREENLKEENRLREEALREESRLREDKLQEVINKNQTVIAELAEKFDVVENIQHDVTDIKIKLEKVG